MTPTELRATLARLGLSQTEAAKLLGVSRKSITNWLAQPGTPSSRPIPEVVVRMLLMIEDVPQAMRFLLAASAFR